MKTTFLTLALTWFSLAIFGQPSTFVYQTNNNHDIITLAEGQGKMPPSVLIGATPEMLMNTMPEGEYQSATNAFLIRTAAGQNVLIDAGLGRNLVHNLAQHNVTPDRIDVILITHMHGDHIGGLVDQNDEKVFPNATVYLAQLEHDYFTNPSSPLNENARRLSHAFVNAYRDQLVLFGSDQGMIADIAMPVPNYGHTPGHTIYLIDDEMMIWGDMVHAMAVQMPYPRVSVTFDVHPERAIEARLIMLEYIVGKGYLVGGMHIPHPGMGRLAADGRGGYVFTPFE